MIGLLKEKSEMEKLKKEYQTLSEQNFDSKKNTTEPAVTKEELILSASKL